MGNYGIDAASNRIDYRTTLQFAPGQFPTNAGVFDAELTLNHIEHVNTCSTRTMLVKRNSGGYSSKFWTGDAPTSSSDMAPFADTCGFNEASYRYVDVTGFVDGWVRQHYGNWGVTIAPQNEAELNTGRGFASSNAGLAPTIDFSYENLPGEVAPTAPADQSVLLTTTPTMSVTTAVHDVDTSGTPTYYFFRMSTAPDAESGERIDSGWLPDQTAWTPPFGYLRDGLTYYWHVYTWDNNHPDLIQDASPIRSFRIDSRRGDGGVSPTDSFGPATVNLATGNVSLRASTPSFNTVGGAQSFTASYNSQETADTGLSGEYFNDANHNGLFDDPQAFRRTDSTVNFNWGSGPPSQSAGSDYFMARWTGYFTAPTAGTYTMGIVHDDGARLYFGNTQTASPDEWGTPTPPAEIHWGTSQNLSKGQTVPVRLEYREVGGVAYVGLYLSGPGYGGTIVPSSLLTTTTRSLPTGWSFSTDLDGDLAYTNARVSSNAITLYAPDGATTAFSSTSGGGWKGPADQDAVLTQEPDGTFSLFGDDGRNYRFDGAGNLLSVASSLDIKNPAAPVYTYGSVAAAGSSRLLQVTDPVSNRAMSLFYGGQGTCDNRSAPPSGLQGPAPIGMVCRVTYWDGTQTNYWYNSNGQLAQIDNPGVGSNAEVTSFRYDASNNIDQIRDARAADFVVAGKRVDDDSVRTRISYNGSDRVTAVRLPDPETGMSGTPVRHSYTYPSATESRGNVDGLPSPPAGFARRVTFDAGGRLTSETDAAGLTTTKTWRSSLEDLPVASIGPDGMQTTTLYDHANRPTHSWGPAQSGWFNADGTPKSANQSQIPHATTSYDEGWQSLSVSYWNNPNLAGSPKAIELGVGRPDGQIARDYIASPPPLSGLANGTDNFSLRATGEVRLRQAGTYTFRVYSDDGVRLLVDDTSVINQWVPQPPTWSTGTFVNGGDSWHRVRLDYFNATSSAVLQLEYTPPSNVNSAIPGYDLAPRYGFATSQTDADNHKTATEFAQPQFGQATATVQDPPGCASPPCLNLRSSTAYEPQGVNYFRVTSSTMPKGGTATNEYYGATQAVTDPCGQLGSVNQAGALRLKTEVDPDGGGAAAAIQREIFYDARGRGVAARVVGDAAWSCTRYDGRGRVTMQSDSTGSATWFDHADPTKLITSFNDTGGNPRSTTVVTNLLGWTTKYTDEWATATRTDFDQVGRESATYRTLSGSTESQLTATAYSTNGRLASTTDFASGTGRTTTYSYDAVGRPEIMTLSNGVKTTTGYSPNLGTTTSITHANASATLSDWTYGRALSGDVTSETGAGRTRAFTYDNAGRLTKTIEGSTTRRYAYDANTNRCGLATSCDGQWSYDSADRMTASPYGSEYTYDSHGNLRQYRTPGSSTNTSFSHAVDYSPGDGPRTYPLNVANGGTVNAQADWTPDAALRTQTSSGALGAYAQPGWYGFAGPPRISTQSTLSSTFAYEKSVHSPPQPAVTYGLPPGEWVAKDFTAQATGSFSASASWASGKATYPSAAGNVGPATSVAAPTFTTTGNGQVTLTLTWGATLGVCSGAGGNLPPPKLDIVLKLNNAEVATTNTAANKNTVTMTYNVNQHTTFPSTKTFTPFVKSTATGCAWTITGTYPVTDQVALGLYNADGLIESTLSESGVPNVQISMPSISPGDYFVRATSQAIGSPSLSLIEAHPVLDYADVTLEFHNPAGVTIAQADAVNGSVAVPYNVPGPGGYYWSVGNFSPDLTVPSYTWSTSTMSLGSGSWSGSVPADVTTQQRTLVAFSTDVGGPVKVHATWTPANAITNTHMAGTLQILDSLGRSGDPNYPFAPYGSQSVALGSGTAVADFTGTLPAGGDSYILRLTTSTGSVGSPSFNASMTYPMTATSNLSLQLLDPSGQPVPGGSASGAVSKPAAFVVSGLAEGAYSLVASSVGGGAGTLSGVYTSRNPYVTFGYDAKDHATSINDGQVTVTETLSASGRVLRHREVDNNTGAVYRDEDYGYDDAGDSPAYRRPHEGGFLNTFLQVGDGLSAIATGAGITYQHANAHGDIVGESTNDGSWHPRTPTDEFGVGPVENGGFRLGWLGTKERFTSSTSTGIMRMGVRLYDPRVGRFLSVDPIEGGNANDYAYVDDPVNMFDLDGKCGVGNPFKKCGKGHKGRTLRGFLRGVSVVATVGALAVVLVGGAPVVVIGLTAVSVGASAMALASASRAGKCSGRKNSGECFGDAVNIVLGGGGLAAYRTIIFGRVGSLLNFLLQKQVTNAPRAR